VRLVSGEATVVGAGVRSTARRSWTETAGKLYVPVLAAATAGATAAALVHLQLVAKGWPTFAVFAAAAAAGRLAGSRVTPSCSDAWSLPFVLAGALLLPLPLVAPVGAAGHAFDWTQEERGVREETFAVSRTIASALIAGSILHAVALLHPSWSLGVVLAAIAFTATALLLPEGRAILGGQRRELDLSVEAAIAALGILLATLWRETPWLLPVAAVPLLALHAAVAASRLRREAVVDPKTGLFNSRQFAVALDQELERARRLGKPVSLLMADLDLLREVNNTHGHLAGDAVLAGVAGVISRALRPYDVAARFGGEEFAVLLPGTNAEAALEVAERIRRGVAGSRWLPGSSGNTPRVTISIGVAVYPDDAANAEMLLHRADLAVYRAKVQGRNRVHAAGDDPLSNPPPLRLEPSEPLPALIVDRAGALRHSLPALHTLVLWALPRVAAVGLGALLLGLLAGFPRWMLALGAAGIVPLLVMQRRAPFEQAQRAQELWRAAESMHAHTRSVEKVNRELLEDSTAAMETLSAVVDARDAHTAGHSRRVQQISLAIGRELGMSHAELEVLSTASLFHDIGKVSVPESILLKPARLDSHEWRIVQRHPAEGARLLGRLGFLADALPAIRHHHERYDGSGYPDGLQGEEIPLGARIVNVADALDAMLTTRVYRRALTPLEALEELRAGAGTQFCPRCVAALDRVVLAEFAKGADPASPELLASA
jgi:diguanylate cyclase (GGDEF)-like protein